MSGVVGKVGEVKGLVDHALSSECSITMEKDTHNSVTCVHGGGGEKYWRELNLAVGPQIAIAKVLTDLNLVVW